jgi:hypothetical protein
MKKTAINKAATALAKARWEGVSEEERVATARRAASTPRTAKRCFCGQESMWKAANRYFDCCRRAGVITLNLELKRELNDGRKNRQNTEA